MGYDIHSTISTTNQMLTVIILLAMKYNKHNNDSNGICTTDYITVPLTTPSFRRIISANPTHIFVS